MGLHCIICIVVRIQFRAQVFSEDLGQHVNIAGLTMLTSPKNATSPMIAVHDGLMLSNTMTTLEITICTLDAETRKGISLNEEIKKCPILST